MRTNQYGQPFVVGSLGDVPASALKRVHFFKSASGTASSHGYDERWLQHLISAYPALLPIDQLEPALRPVISVCMELQVSAGYVDNLFVTPRGDLIIAETKLFRNPEARREVVSQIMDYAKDIATMTYAELDRAILAAEAPTGGGHPATNLFGAVATLADEEEIAEAEFVDNVARNLRRGRFLLLVIGDGIRSETERIADFLQQHAGMHFTFGLVEMAVFELPQSEGYLVQPRVLARTVNIERGIVSIEDGRIVARGAASTDASGKPGRRSIISEERFYEELERVSPDAVPRLRAFMREIEPLGVVPDFGASSMILRWRPDDIRAWNLGTITVAGKVWTDTLNAQADSVGLLALSHAYLANLAALVPKAYVKEMARPTSRYVAKDGTYVTVGDLLSQAEGWREAVRDFTEAATRALKDRDEAGGTVPTE